MNPNPSPIMRIATRTRAVLAFSAVCLLYDFTLHAQVNGTWTGSAGDSLYTDTANWTNGYVASGSGATADFSQFSFNTNTTLHLNSPETLGYLIFGNTFIPSTNSWLVDTNAASGNILTLAGSATPVITVTNLGTNLVDFLPAIAGTQGFIKDGPGTLVLSNVDTFSGTVTVKRGALIMGPAGSPGLAVNPYILGDPAGGDAALLINLGGTVFTNPITCAAGATGNLLIGSSGTAKSTFNGNIVLNGNTLTISNSAASTAKLLVYQDTISGNGNVTLVNNGSAAAQTQVSDMAFTGTLTILGNAPNAAGILTPAFAAPYGVSNITYSSSLTGVGTFSAPANSNGLTIVSTSSNVFPGSGQTMTLPNGLTNVTLNANSNGSITVGAVYQGGIPGKTINSGTGTGYVYIPVVLYSASISNLIQNSATSPLVLSGANYYSAPTLVSNGTLLVNGAFSAGQKGSPITVYSGGILGGSGGIANLVTVQAGGTLAPGTNTPATNATLTLTNNGTSLLGALSLSGNLYFKLNKYGTTKTNDYVVGTTALTNLGTGTLTVTNIGSVGITNGDRFVLFSSPLLGGSNLTIVSSYGKFTNNLSVDGSITAGVQGPFITSNSPAVGSTFGGTTVNIYGSGFSPSSTVTFGGVAAASFAFVNSTNVTVTTPAGSAGSVPEVVTNPDGQSATNSFTYVAVPAPGITSISPTSGPSVGGTTVTITGSNFANGDTVKFGSSPPITATFNSSTSLTVTTPAHAGGAVNVTVTDSYGQTATLAGAFNFIQPTPDIWVAANGGGDGLWTGDAANWTNGVIPNGVDQTADFSEGDYTGAQLVHVDAAITVGYLDFGTTDTNTAVQWTVDNNSSGAPGNILTLKSAVGMPTIKVADPLALGNTAALACVVAGTNGLALTGGGMLTLGVYGGTVTNTFTGGITVANGTLNIVNSAGDASSSDPVVLGSTNLGASATLMLGNAALPNPITLATNATIIGDTINGGRAALSSATPLNLNGNTLTFIMETNAAAGNAYFQAGVSGSGNLVLVQNAAAGSFILNNGTYANSGSLTFSGTGTGQFKPGTFGSSLTAINYLSSTATFYTVPTVNPSASGTTINSSSTLNFTNSLGTAAGNNLTANANSTGNILINSWDTALTGSFVNSGSGTGSTTISAGIYNNAGISSVVQYSATSPLILSGGNYYTVPTLVSNGTLLDDCIFVAGQKGSPITVYNGGVLGGTGSIANSVKVLAGGTLAPGTNDGATIATLTLTNSGSLIGSLTLSGNLLFKVNNSAVQSNDFVTGTAALTNLGTGILTISNLGPALVPGNSFKLFSNPLLGGSNLTIVGPATFVNNLSVDGSILVGTGTSTPPPPASGTISVSGSSLSIVWTGGTNQTTVVLNSTNVTLPVSMWTPVATNMVGANGLFTNTFPVIPGSATEFYLLAIPY